MNNACEEGKLVQSKPQLEMFHKKLRLKEFKFCGNSMFV